MSWLCGTHICLCRLCCCGRNGSGPWSAKRGQLILTWWCVWTGVLKSWKDINMKGH